MTFVYMLLIAGVVFIITRQLKANGKINPLAGFAAMALFLIYILISAIENASISAEFIALFGISIGLLGNLVYRDYKGSEKKDDAESKSKTEAAG